LGAQFQKQCVSIGELINSYFKHSAEYFYQVNICQVKSIQIIGIGIKILFEAAL